MTPRRDPSRTLLVRIEAALRATPGNGQEPIVPTLLLDRHELPERSDAERIEDQILRWFDTLGLFADRSRRSMYGYPGIVRELTEPAPWTDPIDYEETLYELTSARQTELRPLYLWASEDDSVLTSLFLGHLRDEVRALDLSLPNSRLASLWRLSSHEFESVALAGLRAKLALARALGIEQVEALIDVVFDDYNPFRAAVGAPDLLVWSGDTSRHLWFFVEVKGPGDSLRKTQYQWLLRHWDVVRGHVLLVVVA